MNKGKIYYLLAVVVIFPLLWSCNDDTSISSEELSDTPIVLEANLISGFVTRSNPETDIQNRAFEPNTEIGVYIKTAGESPKIIGKSPNVYITSASEEYISELTAKDSQTYYPNNSAVNIFAVYPCSVKPGNDGTIDFSVSKVQNESTYRQCDLMHASVNNQNKTNQKVRLQFSHLMTKFIINVKVEEELELRGIKLLNFDRTVTFTPSTGGLGTLSNNIGNGDNETDGITVENNGAALVPPQTINDKRFIAVETNLGTAYFKTTKTFDSGKEYKVDLTVGRINLSVTANITDWTQDGVRQTIQQAGNDDYNITYEQSVPFVEEFRTNPYEQESLVVKKNGSEDALTRYTDAESDYDYSVLFFGNNQAGTATMVISGNPDKDDTRQLAQVFSFTISQATGSLTYPNYSEAPSYGYTYEGEKLKVPYENGSTVNWPCSLACDPGAATFVSTSPTVASVDNNGTVTIHGVGETTIMVSSPGDGNYTAASTSYNLEVTKRSASALNIVLSQTEYTYNGMPCTPGVTVYDGEVAPENMLSVGYSNNLNAGQATVTVTGAGDYQGEGVKNFTINPITTTFTTPENEYSDVSLPAGKSIERPATINHLFGSVTYTSSNNSIATVNANGTVTAVGTVGQTATITIGVTTPSPANYTTPTMTYQVTVANYDRSFEYDINNFPQEYTCERSGTYMLEVWGASGSTIVTSFKGGGGAYIAGTVHLEEGQKLYVYVGGAGSAGTGGRNGGGSASGTNSAGGGGATDISICNGAWNSESHLKSRIIVAGGGGGSLYYQVGSFFSNGMASGGNGGALVGKAGSGVSDAGKGGGMNAAGSSGQNTSAGGFGYGGSYTGTSVAGAGGGGWYGGGSGGDRSRHGAGGGGSSYIWNETYSSYYPGGAPLTTGSKVTDATAFYIVPLGSGAGQNSGNGKAKISYVSDD